MLGSFTSSTPVILIERAKHHEGRSQESLFPGEYVSNCLNSQANYFVSPKAGNDLHQQSIPDLILAVPVRCNHTTYSCEDKFWLPARLSLKNKNPQEQPMWVST